MTLRDFAFSDVIERNAERFGERLAFVCGDRRITHRAFAQRVEGLGAGLAHAGLVAGDRLAVLAQNCLEYIELYGAAARLGLIVVPINCRSSADEIKHVIEDTAPKVIVASEEYQSLVADADRRFPFVERRYSLDAATTRLEAFADLRRSGPAPAVPPPAASSASAFVILHTAAVNGRSRGAVLSQGNLLAGAQQLLQAWQMTPLEVHLGVLPLFHVAGISLAMATQCIGGATVLMSRFDAPVAVRAIARERVSVLYTFPPMLAALLDAAGDGGAALSSLRNVGGLDSPEPISRFEPNCPAARFWASYGQSETAGTVTVSPYRDRPGSAGRPAVLGRVRVVDDCDEPLPAGQTGEIVVRGPSVFLGYWQCEDDNVLTFRHGWHHTGDLGRFDGDGYLWYAGRSPAKELIKPGGENVYPSEVERALLEHPAVAAAVVFGVPDVEWGEAIKAVCVCHAGRNVSAEELIEFVGARIARFKRPKHLVFTVSLPRTAQGEIDRNATKQAFVNG